MHLKFTHSSLYMCTHYSVLKTFENVKRLVNEWNFIIRCDVYDNVCGNKLDMIWCGFKSWKKWEFSSTENMLLSWLYFLFICDYSHNPAVQRICKCVWHICRCVFDFLPSTRTARKTLPPWLHTIPQKALSSKLFHSPMFTVRVGAMIEEQPYPV